MEITSPFRMVRRELRQKPAKLRAVEPRAQPGYAKQSRTSHRACVAGRVPGPARFARACQARSMTAAAIDA
jgi:hypothetical protein